MSIKEIADLLLNAKEPEDVFEGNTKEEIKKSYRNLAKICHPDKVSENEKELAGKLTIILNNLYKVAQEKIEKGIYNLKDIKEIYKKSEPLFSFKIKNKTYDIYECIKEEDVSTIYEGLQNDELIALKIVNDENDNNLIDEEFKLLQELKHLGLPQVISKLKINGRNSIILKKEPGFSFEEIIKEYKNIPEEHIFWILERMLSLIGYLHSNKIVHGNIKPENIIIDVENHNVKIMDYTLCIKNAHELTSKYKIINDDYTPDYVSKDSIVIPHVDIYAVAKLAIELMGGDIRRNAMPLNVSLELRTFIRKMINYKENDAWKLWDELIELRNKRYGKTRFQKLERKLK